MNLLESLRVATRGLASNKMRTLLTMLGIIIGVAVVILVVAIGQGATQRVKETIDSLGTNLLTVWNGQQHVKIAPAVNKSTGDVTGTGTGTAASSSATAASPTRLKMEDARNIVANFPQTIDAVAPQVRSNVQIRLGGTDASSNMTGTSVDYPYVNNAPIDRGRFFTDAEVDGSQKVCVVGVSVAEHLTGSAGTDLTGKTISVNRQQFQVVGMLSPKGAGAWGQDQDDVILAPISTAMRRIMNRANIDSMSIRCVSQKSMPLAQEQVSNYLRNKHHLTPPFPDNDDFVIRSQTDLMQSQQSVTSTMTTLLSIVAVISLVVGGIGIMNIMLVSVTERTREIGIRKAIGATPRDILLQFLIESAIISLLGGLVGVGIGIAGARLLAAVGGWNTIVDPSAVLAALVVSAGVGLFFGIYPATRAAALHPIQALRFE